MKILAVDYGTKRIGLAVSDALGVLASPRPALVGVGDKQAAAAIVKLTRDEACELVLLGLPRNMDGSYGESAGMVRAFAARLEPQLGVLLKLVDERLTTVQASRLLHEQGLNTRKQRQRIDSASAAVLLQGYLDAQAPAPEF
ncbi:MAG: Holliday junction resolvase RuvX [Verrucomicrobiota bacterium]